MENNEEIIVLREKGSLETQLDYIKYIQNEVIPSANGLLNSKNAEISSLKADVAKYQTEIEKLKAEMVSKEKAQIDSEISKTVIDLRANIDGLKDALNDTKNDKRIEKAINKLDDIAKKYEKELEDISNLKVLDEVKSMIDAINTKIEANKEEILIELSKKTYNEVNTNENIEDKQPVLEETKEEEIPQVENVFETEVNNDINNEVEKDEIEEVKEEEVNDIPVSPFEVDDVVNTPVEDTFTNDATFDNPSEEVQEEVKEEENVNAFDQILNEEVSNEINDEETIKADENVISSVEEAKEESETPKEETPEVVNENEITNEGEEVKVTNVEPIPEEIQNEILKNDKPAVKITSKLTKVKRSFVNEVKDDIANIKTKKYDFVRMTSSMADRFKNNTTPAMAMAEVPVDVPVEEDVKTR